MIRRRRCPQWSVGPSSTARQDSRQGHGRYNHSLIRESGVQPKPSCSSEEWRASKRSWHWHDLEEYIIYCTFLGLHYSAMRYGNKVTRT